MIYGYGRVSTKGQEMHGNSLVDQVDVLTQHGAQEIVTESYTGTKMERPRFTALVNSLQPGDTLIVTKLDRFARNTSEGCKLMQELVERGVTVNVLNMGIANNTPMGKLMVTILFAFAEYERDMIVERTQGGKAVAKRNPNFREGRPDKYTTAQLEHALSLLEGNSYSEVERLTGISKSTLIRQARKRGRLKG